MRKESQRTFVGGLATFLLKGLQKSGEEGPEIKLRQFIVATRRRTTLSIQSVTVEFELFWQNFFRANEITVQLRIQLLANGVPIAVAIIQQKIPRSPKFGEAATISIPLKQYVLELFSSAVVYGAQDLVISFDLLPETIWPAAEIPAVKVINPKLLVSAQQV